MVIKTGADIANEITSYEALHEPSLNTKEYIDLVGAGWVPLSWLQENLDVACKRLIRLTGDKKSVSSVFESVFHGIIKDTSGCSKGSYDDVLERNEK
jgi:hypothetical protein